MALDASQQEAVDCNDQYLQIVGHPGTGKTMVMGNRIARLLREGVAPESIVALTFSTSARASLKERLTTLLGDTDIVNAVEINTFHSFCAETVKQFPEDVGLSSEWRMIDALDMYNILADPSLDIPRRNRSTFPSGYSEEHQQRFRMRLARYKAYDFDTAMMLGCQIVAKRDLGIRHLLIDEFQDIQLSQWELATTMARVYPPLNICVVGDPNQEIFNFRADNLRRAFAVMCEAFPKTRILNLKYNYRSSPQILQTFQNIIPQSSPYKPNMIATRPSGLEPELSVFASAPSETAAVVDLIRRLKKRYKAGDIAVLVRFNREALQLQRELVRNGIATLSAVNVRAMASKTLPNLTISLLKWANEPRDLYLAQLLYNNHHKVISSEDYARLCSRGAPTGSIVNALSTVTKSYEDHPFIASQLPRIRNSLLNSETPAELVNNTILAIENWRALAGTKTTRSSYASAGWLEFKRALKTIDQPPALVPLAESGDREPGLVLKAVLGQLFHGNELEHEDRVHVQTIHSAKSREWPAVIVACQNSQNYQFLGFDEEGEQRLLYVAASRAREQLYFTSNGVIGDDSMLKFLKTQDSKLMMPHKTAAALYPKQYLRVLARVSAARQLLL